MSLARFKNNGAFIAAVDSGVAFNAVAAGTNDNTAKAGVIIDRLAHEMPLSMSLIAQFSAALAAGKKLFLGYRIEHGEAADLSDTADIATQAVTTQVATSAGGGTVTGVAKYDFDMSGWKRYIRINITTDLDAANTDTSVVAAAVVLGGESVNPAV